MSCVIGGNASVAKPTINPPMKTNAKLMMSAMLVSNKNLTEPVKMASKNPTHGIINGATKIPNNKMACESNKNPRPNIAPHTNEKINNSIDGYARLANDEINAA